jgi:hypothetical protein
MATGLVTCPRGAEPISNAFSEDIVDPDPAFIFRWACDMGLDTGLQRKNLESEAVRRQAEEGWGC